MWDTGLGIQILEEFAEVQAPHSAAVQRAIEDWSAMKREKHNSPGRVAARSKERKAEDPEAFRLQKNAWARMDYARKHPGCTPRKRTIQ